MRSSPLLLTVFVVGCASTTDYVGRDDVYAPPEPISETQAQEPPVQRSERITAGYRRAKPKELTPDQAGTTVVANEACKSILEGILKSDLRIPRLPDGSDPTDQEMSCVMWRLKMRCVWSLLPFEPWRETAVDIWRDEVRKTCGTLPDSSTPRVNHFFYPLEDALMKRLIRE